MISSITGQYLPMLNSENRPEPALYADGDQIPRDSSVVQKEAVSLSISKEAANLLTQTSGEFLPPASSEGGKKLKKENKSPEKLSPKEKNTVEKLKKRDAEVRAHELQHLAAAGAYAVGGIKFEYEMGPDGKLYAVGGSVDLDVSTDSDNPEENLRKARSLKAAAMAVGDPSSADMSIVSDAAKMEAEAGTELVEDATRTARGSGPASEILNAYKSYAEKMRNFSIVA